MLDLEKQVKELMKEGVYDPETLFQILYRRNPYHYSKVREAIHNAKQS